MKLRLVRILLSTLVAGAVFSQAYAQQIALNNSPREFREQVTENSKVSGDVIMGVMLNGDQPQTHPLRVTAWTPNLWTGSSTKSEVCVRIVSKDGRYEAENNYVIPAGYDEPIAEFPYEGNSQGFLAERQAVIRVGVGPCGRRPQMVVPAGWVEFAGSSEAVLSVFINSAGNSTFAAVGKGDDFFEECASVSEIDGLKYTSLCEIPLHHLNGRKPTNLTFVIARNNSDERFTVQIAPLQLNG